MARRPAVTRTLHEDVLTLGERQAALEAMFSALQSAIDRLNVSLEKLADKVATATAHDALAARVASLEEKTNFAAGAGRVRERGSETLHEWARTFAGLLWPVALAVVGSVAATNLGG